MSYNPDFTNIVVQVPVREKTYSNKNNDYRPEKRFRKGVFSHVACYLQLGKIIYLIHLFQFRKTPLKIVIKQVHALAHNLYYVSGKT